MADLIGRKKVFLIALVINYIAVAVLFIATSNPVFFVGKMLNGLVIGIVGSVMVSYIGEVRRSLYPCVRNRPLMSI